VSRSGNQSDVAPSAFELSLRSGLTAVLGVRPRFKEFLIGFPLMMLLPALTLRHRQVFGWLFALGIGIGTADMIDTFSHLHTPLEVSLIRLLNGLVIGCIVGAIAVLAYRRWGRVGAAPG
jgi:flagellar biosynthesis protein FliR